jgi:CBS domain-containing protein
MGTIVGDACMQKQIKTGSDGRAPLHSDTVVSWIMNREVMSVLPDLSLTSLESLFVSQDLSRVPVVDDSGLLIGVVSKTDLVAHHLDQGDARAEPRTPALDRLGSYSVVGLHLESCDTVADIMSQSVLTVTQETTIARAAELMVVNRVHGLPVVVSGGKVIGWISSLDILSWVAEMT